MSRYDDDYYRREEQRRWTAREDARRDQHLADMRAEQRRRDWQRDEQRREDQRRAAIEDEDRRRRRAEQERERERGMSLLKDGFTQWGAAVLGLDPDGPAGTPAADPPPKPASAPPLAFDWPRFRASFPEPANTPAEALSAPRLARIGMSDGTIWLTWTMVPGAASYAVEESPVRSFLFATEIYRGEATDHSHGSPRPLFLRPHPRQAVQPLEFFRVKAVAATGAGDSEWSNVV